MSVQMSPVFHYSRNILRSFKVTCSQCTCGRAIR